MRVAYLLALILTAAPQEPTEVFLCPIHRDVQSVSPGVCSVCNRPLEKKRLRVVWACPMHPSLKGDEGGACPACHMALAPITIEARWVCSDDPDALLDEPGPCKGILEEREMPMPHGDHNPRHGGVLFMAPDGFHHVEGTLSPAGAFRLYLYDNFTRPLDARPFRARIEYQFMARDPTPAPDGLRAVRPLSVTAEGEALETVIPTGLAASPDSPEVTVFLQFPEGREERFDFVFANETSARPVASSEIPEKPEGLIEGILLCAQRLDALIERGAWAELYIPAMEAKTLALTLEEKGYTVKKIVRAAWLLDMYGDVGNRLKVEEAYGLFRAGIEDLRSSIAK